MSERRSSRRAVVVVADESREGDLASSRLVDRVRQRRFRHCLDGIAGEITGETRASSVSAFSLARVERVLRKVQRARFRVLGDVIAPERGFVRESRDLAFGLGKVHRRCDIDVRL